MAQSKSKSAASTPSTIPSPAASSTSTPSTVKSPRKSGSAFDRKLQRIEANDKSMRHFQGCWGDDLSEAEAIRLLAALERSNDAVKSIEFCSNPHLGVPFCRALARLLERNHDFAVVSLRGNAQLGDAGVKLLCQSLEKNARVLDLFLDGCGVGESGAVAIGKMLSFNRKLFRLDVSQNLFSSTGVDFIAEGVIENGKWVRMDRRRGEKWGLFANNYGISVLLI